MPSRAHEEPAPTLTGAAAHSRWAQLLARIYEVSPLRCPESGSDMRILALPSATSASLQFLTDPGPTGAILRHLDLPHTAPRLSPARAPPQAALALDADPVADVDPVPHGDFDPTPAFDPADPEPVPELDFDQTRGA